MRLQGRKIGILMESDFYEDEILYYKHRFPEEGLETHFLTRLWGNDRITFHGHEYKVPFEVSESFEGMSDAELHSYDAIIVPSAIVSDRLRYSEDVTKLSPATEFIKRAFADPSIVKGIICHGMWLVSPAPELVRGRPVVAHNNLIGDVRNMGAIYTDQDVVIDRDLVTARTGGHCHLFARAIIDLLVERAGDPTGDRSAATSAASSASNGSHPTAASPGTPAATGSGSTVPTSVMRFSAASPTTTPPASARQASGSGAATPAGPGGHRRGSPDPFHGPNPATVRPAGGAGQPSAGRAPGDIA